MRSWRCPQGCAAVTHLATWEVRDYNGAAWGWAGDRKSARRERDLNKVLLTQGQDKHRRKPLFCLAFPVPGELVEDKSQTFSLGEDRAAPLFMNHTHPGVGIPLLLPWPTACQFNLEVPFSPRPPSAVLKWPRFLLLHFRRERILFLWVSKQMI